MLINIYNGLVVLSGSNVGLKPIPTIYNTQLLVVGGGGSGGRSFNKRGGGGGAGQFIYLTGITLQDSYSIVIGAGGSDKSGSPSYTNLQGKNTSIGSYIAYGGGYGGGDFNDHGTINGGDGASSGGGESGGGLPGTATNGFPGYSGVTYGGAGGGAGGAAAGITPGQLVQNSISGTLTNYCWGGSIKTSTGNGTDQTIIGGGGQGAYSGYFAGNGANGIVIIRYTSSTQLATGGTVTTSGGDYIHTFTSNGTFTIS